jgi:predicted type IV restriction endonuclease
MIVDIVEVDQQIDGLQATVETTLRVTARDPQTQAARASFRIGYRFGLVHDGTRWLVCTADYLGER